MRFLSVLIHVPRGTSVNASTNKIVNNTMLFLLISILLLSDVEPRT